ncbi:MAG: S-methyl-5'-thioadenosine phosphorylase [Actinomycetales bacterium]|nr:S-methyl-5'-thioadenosine phosphorylase [Actinomycetales bacterium]
MTAPATPSGPAPAAAPGPGPGPDAAEATPGLPRAEIGVIGGSGFYSFLTGAQRVSVDTPFGAPSDDLVVGRLGDRDVAFIARHGHDHRFPPHRVNYRANLWALRSLGVRQVVSPCAVGGLRPHLGPGTVVIPDQVVDRTWGREHTVYGEVGAVVHVGFADPYCPAGRAAAAAAATAMGANHQGSGTLVVVNGPRFSSRAESLWHQGQGWDIVGMTAMPEAAIARELAMCFTTVALVTDLDAGVEHGDGVTHSDVLAVFADNVPRFKALIADIVGRLPATEPDGTATCGCRRSLDGRTLPFPLP